MKPIDFIAAGQNRSTFAVFLTLLATILGASATLGVAESAGKIGFPAVWWLLCGCIGLALQAAFLSSRIRDAGARTLPELARLTVGPAAQRLVAAVIVISWPAVVGAQFVACAGLVNAFTGSDARTAPILVAAAVVIIYTLAGGQRAVVRTDAWELLVLAIGFGGLFLWVFSGMCGGAPVPSCQIRLFSEAFTVRDLLWMLPTVAGAYFLGPDIASRSIVARDGRTARRAVMASVPVLALFAIAIALAGLWAATNAPGAGNPVLRIASRLPAALRWCLAAGLLAALLSSADTCLVNAAAILSHDLLGLGGVRAARGAVAAIGLAATALALFGKDIIGILLLAYSVYVPGVVCPLAAAVISRGRIAPRLWLAAVAVGGTCGVISTFWRNACFLPSLGMLLSLAVALLSLRPSMPKRARATAFFTDSPKQRRSPPCNLSRRRV